MNFIEKYLERKIRRISWKLTNIPTKNNISKALINRPLLDRNLKERIELQENIRKIYNVDNNYDNDTFIESYELDEDIASNIENLQKLFLIRKNQSYSEEEIIMFLLKVMNYGKFQLMIMENKHNGKELTLNNKLRQFFKENSLEKILELYDMEQNYDNLNRVVEKNEEELLLIRSRKK